MHGKSVFAPGGSRHARPRAPVAEAPDGAVPAAPSSSARVGYRDQRQRAAAMATLMRVAGAPSAAPETAFIRHGREPGGEALLLPRCSMEARCAASSAGGMHLLCDRCFEAYSQLLFDVEEGPEAVDRWLERFSRPDAACRRTAR